MKKLVLILLALIVLVVLGVVGYLGYLGFIPGVSSLFGSDKPRDLGVSYSEAQYEEYNEKANFKTEVVNEDELDGTTVKYLNPKKMTASYSQEEVSARINYAKYKYMPVKDVQIKFNNDGSVEYSSIVILDNIPEVASVFGYTVTDEQIGKAMDYLELLPVNPPVYAKGVPVIKNNTFDFNLQKLEVGRLSIDPAQYDLSNLAEEVAQQVIDTMDGVSIDSAVIENGKVNFKGTVPTLVKEVR